MSTDDEAVAGVIVAFPVVALVMCYMVWADAFVLRRLWGWFVEPSGFAPLSWRLAVGIGLMVSVVMPLPRGEANVPAQLMSPWILCAVGAVANLWLN